jgi:hypothetical protein
MLMGAPRHFCSFLALFGLCVIGSASFAGSGKYHYTLSLDPDGKPALQLTNDSDVPIMAFILVEFPSLGMEGRTYYDFYLNQRDLPIAPRRSMGRGTSYFRGSESKVRAEVRAVIFQDGVSEGDPVWVSAILAQRLQFYDRLHEIYELLEKQVGARISREEILQMLKAARDTAEKQSEDDDLRPIDSAVFSSAISTFDKNREAPIDQSLQRYLAYVRLRIAQLDRSRPAMGAIRTLPRRAPKPLSDASLEFRAALALSSLPVGAPSSCTPEVPFEDSPTPALSCKDTSGDPVTQNNTYTFSVTFSQYNSTTGKTKPVPWTSAGQGSFTAVGVCYQFNDCDDSSVVYYVQGQAYGQGAANSAILPGSSAIVATQGGSSIQFYWMLDNYQDPTLSQCDACDTCPSCQESPQSSDPQVPTTYWYYNYACTFTP